MLIQHSLFSNENIIESSWFANALAALSLTESPGWPDCFGDLLLEWHKSRPQKDIRVLSLFSGAGGLDIGFHDAGFKILECNEIEKDFAATLSLNSQLGRRLYGSKIICQDINDYYPEIDEIDFVIGGPPCQTFSAAGARAAGVNGIDDERGNLFQQYVRILKQLNPIGFLFENVYRIVGAQGGKPWQLIQDAFREAGYKLYWRILDAADFGVPQFRERLIIVGLKEGNFQFPYPTHGPDSTDNRPYYSTGSAIADVESKVSGSTVGGRHGYLLDEIPPGLNYSYYTEKMGHPTPHFGWRSKFSDYLYKADPDTPVRTIKAQGGQYTGPFHWENRTFTIEELKRLQTFPDSYLISGNRQKSIHQLGNAVPPQLARILALSIRQQVFNRVLPFRLQLLPDDYALGFRSRKSQLTKIYAKKAAEAICKLTINRSETTEIVNSKKGYCILMENFILKNTTNDANWAYYFEHKMINGHIDIQLWDQTKSQNHAYQYTIKPAKRSQSHLGIQLITMKSFSQNEYGITAIWKYLESLVKAHYHKDDLVQLFGYYQSPNQYRIALEYNNKTLEREYFWHILANISKGHLVGKITKMTEISTAFDIEPEILVSQLRKLKSLGFEIRNHNTNQQIKEGYVLVPYSFPSLNERSLQRLTEL
jgi:DNA (cytosine-5)-methyltransferase 1